MWSKDKILAKVALGDNIRITVESGLVWQGILLEIDDSLGVITVQDNENLQNICIEDILVVTKIQSQKSVDKLLKTEKESDANNIKRDTN